MYKEDDEHGVTKLHFDFSGTDPQADTSINFLLSPTMWKMFVMYVLCLSEWFSINDTESAKVYT